MTEIRMQTAKFFGQPPAPHAGKVSHGAAALDKRRLLWGECGLRPGTEAGESLGMAVRVSKRLGGAVGAGLVMLATGGARAQDQPPAAFPIAMDRQDLVGWLRRETDITPAQVVAVSPSAVTAVLGAIETASPRGVRMALRAEAIDAQVSDREGALSWHMVVEADCEGHRLRQGETTGYAGRNLLGDGRKIRPASDTWSQPPAGSQLENVWRAACEPDFQRPLSTPRKVAAARSVTPAPLRLRPLLIQDIHPPPTAPVAKVERPLPPVRTMAIGNDPETPRSTAAVQLGALATSAAAEAMLASLRTGYVGAMQGLSTRVAPASVGGRTVYRALVTGFTRAVDARQFCAGLKTGGVACFVR